MLRTLISVILLAQILFIMVPPGLAFVESDRAEWAKLYEKTGRLLDRGKDQEAEATIRKLLKIEDFSKIHKILSLELLGEVLDKQKKYSEEEAVLRNMLERMRNAVFPINLIALTSLKLADLNFTLGRYALAREDYEVAIPLLKSAFGPYSYEVALAINNLAFTEVQDEKFLCAAEHFHEALRIIEEKAGKESELYGRVATNLADDYERLEDWNSARQWYEKAITALSHSCGEKDVNVLELEKYIIKFRSAGKGGVFK